jgi:hypothetical protein
MSSWAFFRWSRHAMGRSKTCQPATTSAMLPWKTPPGEILRAMPSERSRARRSTLFVPHRCSRSRAAHCGGISRRIVVTRPRAARSTSFTIRAPTMRAITITTQSPGSSSPSSRARRLMTPLCASRAPKGFLPGFRIRRAIHRLQISAPWMPDEMRLASSNALRSFASLRMTARRIRDD